MRIGWRDSILRAMDGTAKTGAAGAPDAAGAAGPAGAADDERLAPTFAAIVIVQVGVIIALFWAGKVFGS
jgi:hypothetical protein